MSKLLEHTKKFMEEADIEDRKKKGQYFTKEHLKNKSLKNIVIKDGDQILENSCGTGEFIDSILKLNSKTNVDAFDIDDKLCNLVKKIYPSVNVRCENWLLNTSKKKYDKIIGNPPYFEIAKTRCKDMGYERFLKFCKSKPNIYSFFIAKSIEQLKDGGELIYVVPTSMNNGYGFSPLRDFIIENCNIENIIIHSDDDFDAQQNSMTLHLKKLKNNEVNNGKFIYTNKGITIFSKDIESIKKKFDGKYSLKELGFNVLTGNYVWNQNKKYMSLDTKDTLLIWACNITDSVLKLYPKTSSGNLKLGISRAFIGPIMEKDKRPVAHQKSQHVSGHSEKRKTINSRSIVVNRVTGCGKKAKIRAAIVDVNKPYYTENHVNYIIATEDAKMSLEELHEKLISKETSEILQYISGNTQLSKKELLNLIPIRLDKHIIPWYNINILEEVIWII